MSAPRTLEEVTSLPDELTLRRLLAMLSTPTESGGARGAA